jgi:hypothetical protein
MYDTLFSTLFAKTFFILGCQLLITFLTARIAIVLGMRAIDFLTTESKLPLQLSMVLVVVLNVADFQETLGFFVLNLLRRK